MVSNQTADNIAVTAEELQEYNYYVGMKQSLERLEANPDFQKVILEGYFKDKAINGVSLLASPRIKAEGKRGDIMEALVAISHLQDYFIVTKQLGMEMDDEDIDDDELDESGE